VKETFLATLSPMLMMFICMAVGFSIHKLKAVPENTGTVLSKMETNVFVPALMISTFSRYCTMESARQEYGLILYCLAGVAVVIVLAFPLARLFGKGGYEEKLYQYGYLCANFGYMGDAVVPQILGPEALYPYLLFTMPMKLLCYGWWVTILIPKGEKKGGFLKNLLNPIVVGVIIGVFLGLTGIGKHIPGFLNTSISNLASCMGPVAMVLTGFVIGEYRIPELLKNVKVYLASALRLMAIPTVVITVLWLVGAPEQVLLMSLLAFGTPFGLNMVIFPAAHGMESKSGASMVMISHLLCIVTIPLMFALLREIL
jgi:predicted permease